MKIIILDCQNDLRNYAFIIIDTTTNECLLIDTLDATIITQFLRDNNLKLKYILCTHHHNDHTGGNLTLRGIYNCDIYGNENDKERIRGITHSVIAGDVISLFNNKLQFTVMNFDGHTIGHIGFYAAQKNWLFSGDTIFNLGCGRRFEGSAEQYYKTLQTITALPHDTIIYGSHEYTLDNIAFSKYIMPKNYIFYNEFMEYCDIQTQKRNNNIPTIPFTLESQIKFNPFLLSHTQMMQESLKLDGKNPSDVFGVLRSLKDNFAV
jgi:hydroxyacylglutathione hydrolase